MTILSNNEFGDTIEIDVIKEKKKEFDILETYYNILNNDLVQSENWTEVYNNQIEIKDISEIKFNLSKWITFPSHNSGWKYVYDQLKDLHNPNGLIVDDFIERTFSWSAPPLKNKKFKIHNVENNTFTEYDIPYENTKKYSNRICFKLTDYLYLDNDESRIDITKEEYDKLPLYYKKQIVYRCPWVGFWHNPPESRIYLSKYSDQNQYTHSPDYICKRKAFTESLKTCVGIFVFSNSMKNWVINKFKSMNLTIPVYTLFHPIKFPDKLFSFEKFMENKEKKLLQIGSWLRNLNLIFNIESEYKKIWISRDRDALVRYSNTLYLTDRKKISNILSNFQINKEYQLENNVYLINLDNYKYEEIIVDNIVVTEIIGSSCNNGIIECIASATPILVNKLDSLIEYLGKDYPFYYHSKKELLEKSQNYELINKTHKYLLNLNTRKLITGESFREQFLNCDLFNPKVEIEWIHSSDEKWLNLFREQYKKDSLIQRINSEKLIDFVITWVNSDDENWQKSFEQYHQNNKFFPCDSMTINRYRSELNELKYSLRSLQSSCGHIINKIFIVVHDRQTMPDWLKENDDLIIIKHSQIMDGKTSYNSLSIEACLKNIPNISETFVYLNDDIWLLGNWNIDDFIIDNKIIFHTDFNEKGRVVKQGDGSFEFMWNNTHRLLENLYPDKKNNFRPALAHAPYVLKKSAFIEHDNLPEICLTKKSKFRSYTDIGVVCGFQQYSQYYQEKAIQKKIKELNFNVKKLLETNGNIDISARVLTLQDEFISSLNNNDKTKIFMILDCLFPVPSVFEKI